MSDYNGWTNYETWNVALWIDNDEGSQTFWHDEARRVLEHHEEINQMAIQDLAITLELAHEDNMPELGGTYEDLLRAALSGVDWREVAEHLLNSVEDD